MANYQGCRIYTMQKQSFLGVLFAFLVALDGISGSSVYKKFKKESDADSMIVDSYLSFPFEESVYDSSANAAASSALSSSSSGLRPKRPLEPEISPRNSNIVGILKGTTPRNRRNVSFGEDITYEFFNVKPYDENAERDYIETLFHKNYEEADKMKRRGLVLSNSNEVYNSINKLLKYGQPRKDIIYALFKQQPHVFTQDYVNGRSVFERAPQETIDYIIRRYSDKHPALLRKISFRPVGNPKVVSPDTLSANDENSLSNFKSIETDYDKDK